MGGRIATKEECRLVKLRYYANGARHLSDDPACQEFAKRGWSR
jgi:hypothetical protein